MSVTVKDFGKSKDGQQVNLYSIENANGMIAKVTNYGAILVNLFVPDKTGKTDDVVLGFDSVEEYYKNGSFFGATIGPSANRIANAKFSVDGKEYYLPVNDGPNNLHSDIEKGYHKVVWTTTVSDDSVTFAYSDTDGNMGFPGNKNIKVTYTLTAANELKITYHADSDKNTLINMTNHTYFNLSGHASGKNIHDHVLELKCSRYTPVVEGAIPTGELADVKGTPFDFTTPTAIGDRIGENNEQLLLVQGYDHNWVVDNYDGSVRMIAKVTEPTTGRSFEVYTDQPGVQFYAGNCITPVEGKEKAQYGKRSGMCLETQAFPDSVNQPEFPDVIYGPGRDYDTTTIYKFNW